MLRPRSALYVAIVAMLIVVPAAGHAVTTKASSGGPSCAHPRHWHLSDAEVSKVRDGLGGHSRLTRGPLSIDATYSDTNAQGLYVTASGHWRICRVQGTDSDGTSWVLPAAGSTFSRNYSTHPPDHPRSLSISYALGTSSRGKTCADPLVYSEQSGGDKGASISYEVDDTGSGPNSRTVVAKWHLGSGSRLCYVKGLAFGKQPFTVRDQGKAQYTMGTYDSYPAMGYVPVAYLVIAFRR